MKICVIDECNRKFTGDLIDHWQKQGHEIIFDKYFDPTKVLWADTTLFDFAGNNVQRGSYPDDSFWQKEPQPQNKNIILRVHDLDLWHSQANRVNYNWINHLVFVAEHEKDRFLPDLKLTDKTKVHLIHHGVDHTKFKFRVKKNEKKIAFVGNICDHKRLETALNIMAELPRDYSLHVLGSGLGMWRKAYADYYIEKNNLNVSFTDHVDFYEEWLTDKDMLLHCGVKEAFSFVTAEAALMGLKSMVHNFWGADRVWKDYPFVWNTVSEAVKMIQQEEWDGYALRQYIMEKYDYNTMIEAYSKIL